MKIRNLLIIFLFAPCFLMAQSGTELLPKQNIFSVYGNLQIQFTEFEDINQQTANYGVSEIEDGTAHLALGLQLNVPKTSFAIAAEVSIVETCPHEMEEGEAFAVVQGHGFKLKSSAALLQKNGWSVRPSVGIGYQKNSLRINKDFSSDESGQPIGGFDNKSYTSNFYKEVGIIVEKIFPLRSDLTKSMHLGTSLNFRNAMDKTMKSSDPEHSFIDLRNTNFNRGTLEFYIRFDIL